MPGRIRIPKTALYTTISILVLLVVFVGGGVGYVWYTGQSGTAEVIDTAPVAAKPDPITTPTKPAANAKASASVQVLTSPVAPGENASIHVKTVPTSTCTIKVEYNDIPSTDSGLVKKTADEYGMVDWTWTVGANVPLGTWPATVTCTYNGQSAVVRGDLQVARQAG